MRKDRDFDNIIEGMGGTPKSMIPAPSQPSRSEQLGNIAKTILAGAFVFVLEALIVGYFLMVAYGIAAKEFSLAVEGVGFEPSTAIAACLIVILVILKRAAA